MPVVYAYGGITLYATSFQTTSASARRQLSSAVHHISADSSPVDSVWPVPSSLAVTKGITVVFSSCSY